MQTTDTSPLVYIIILNWNRLDQTLACYESVQRLSYRNYRVVIIDNGSKGGQETQLERLKPAVQLIRNKENLGFTGGVNVGIDRALAEGADYVWLLNNDAEPDSDVLETMVSAVATDERIGLASPLIRNADAADAIDFCGGLREANTFHTTDDPTVYRTWSKSSPDSIWLVGTALLVRRRLIETIGQFDHQFFAYWEDNDYSVRSLKAGFRNVVIPEVAVRHWAGNQKTDPNSKSSHYYYYMSRNEILFVKKHVEFRKIVRPLLWAIDRQFRQIDRLRSYPAAIDAVLMGLWDGMRGRGGEYGSKAAFFAGGHALSANFE